MGAGRLGKSFGTVWQKRKGGENEQRELKKEKSSGGRNQDTRGEEGRAVKKLPPGTQTSKT